MRDHAQQPQARRALGALVGVMVIAAACGGDDDDTDASGESEPQTEEASADAPEDGRCDAGFNTAAFNQEAEPHAPHAHDDTEDDKANFTLEEWAEVFVQPDHPLSDGTPREDVVARLKGDEQIRDAVLSGGVGHDLKPDGWEPLIDPAECEQLAEDLQATRDVVAAYPMVQDALADGYVLVAEYVPGIAAHYINFDLFDEEFELDKPEMLLYDGNGPEANVAGVSHAVMSEDGAPEDGFSSHNQHWHRHLGLCVADGEVIGATSMSEAECQAQGGSKLGGENIWMNHVWVVPGCENDYGVFSGTNPALPLRDEPDEAAEPGCGSGKAPDGELELDDPGDGPGL